LNISIAQKVVYSGILKIFNFDAIEEPMVWFPQKTLWEFLNNLKNPFPI